MKNIKALFKNTKFLNIIHRVIILIITIILTSAIYTVIAAPPTTKYSPGDTLSPSCSPGGTNCTVTSPLSSSENIIEEFHLKAVDTAVDEECLTYESTTGDFEWQSCGASYTAGGTLMDLTSSVFSINEGTLTNGKLCTYDASDGLVCNTDDDDDPEAGDVAWSDLTDDGTFTDAKFCTYDSGNSRINCNATAGETGVTGFTSALNTSSPNNTNNVSSLTASGGSTNQHLALVPKGIGGIIAGIPDSTTAGGNVRGAHAVDLQTLRMSASHVASGDYGTISGGSDNEVSRYYGSIGGGKDNTIFGNYGTVGGGENNLASYWGAVCGGKDNTIAGDYVFIGGGRNNDTGAWGSFGAIAGGLNNYIYARYSFIGSGNNNRISNSNAHGGGILAGTEAEVIHRGEYAHSAGQFAHRGDNQQMDMIVRTFTSNALPSIMYIDNNSNFKLTIPTDTTWSGMVKITGRRTDADNESYGGIFAVTIDNNAGTTALVGTVTTIHEKKDSSWTVSITADDTNDALQIQVTGQSGKTINWIGHVDIAQITG